MNAARIDDEPAADTSFTPLIERLAEFGYTPGDAVDGITAYARSGSSRLVVTIDTARTEEARVVVRDNDDEPAWTIRFTADTPDAAQREILMLAIRSSRDDRPTAGTVADRSDPSDPQG